MTYSFDQTEWYVQDDWRVTRSLTLNLGLRLFVIPSPHVDGNLMTSFLPSAFDPAKAPADRPRRRAGADRELRSAERHCVRRENGVPRGFADTFFGPAPRFGFAYDPTGNGKMSIRGGYGISYLNSGNRRAGWC